MSDHNITICELQFDDEDPESQNYDPPPIDWSSPVVSPFDGINQDSTTEGNTIPSSPQSAESMSDFPPLSDMDLVEPQPIFELIDKDQPVLNRPLRLINGIAYAAMQADIKTSHPDISDPSIIAKSAIERRTIVFSSERKAYGCLIPIQQLNFEVSLRQEVPHAKEWSKKGITKYHNYGPPDATEVFNRIIKVVDHFIDFKKSLSDQNTMCKFIACYILSTWFLDGFEVIGYMWINGERGSGKTNLLILISELSYLGQFISHSGSFASLRDMADYGATLCCDDAETITNPKENPDKQALLLAGNHKGIQVSLKEPGPNRTWTTRYVNAFCPRAFSAINLPDSTLASRCIIVPLLRTNNSKKGNIDPMEYDEWPVNRLELLDDLWALGLSYLPSIPELSKWVGENSTLVGRNLQPWRALLTVAKWLELKGVKGIYQQMENLALCYQEERKRIEKEDPTRLIIEACCECAIKAINASTNTDTKMKKTVTVSVQEVSGEMKSNISQECLDIDPGLTSNAKIGRKLAQLRFDKTPRQGGMGSRLWQIDIGILCDLAASYHIPFSARLLAGGMTVDQYLNCTGTTGFTGSDNI